MVTDLNVTIFFKVTNLDNKSTMHTFFLCNSISRTVMRLHQTGTSSADLSSLMATLGAQSQDWQLISHWGTLHHS
jgi:hypothetical protein